jgi:hypothetical protein
MFSGFASAEKNILTQEKISKKNVKILTAFTFFPDGIQVIK